MVVLLFEHNEPQHQWTKTGPFDTVQILTPNHLHRLPLFWAFETTWRVNLSTVEAGNILNNLFLPLFSLSHRPMSHDDNRVLVRVLIALRSLFTMEPKNVFLSDRPSLYEPLPEVLGGQNSRPVAAAIANLLPYPKGTVPPLEQHLNNSIRQKKLLLDGAYAPDKSTKPSEEQPEIQKKLALESRGSKRGRPNGNKLVLPKEEQKYSIYLPLHQFWKQYASQLHHDNPSTFADRVIRMDFHGALVKVIRSRVSSLIGKTGIVVAETANTLLIVTKEDRALTLPKNVCVVEVEVNDYRIEIYLPALAFRPSERSARKIKKKHMAYI